MATRETRVHRGERRGRMLITRSLTELRQTRVGAGVSQEQLAEGLGISQAAYSRIETGRLGDVGVIALSQIASVLGYEVSVGLHPIGDPVRDKGQLACG